jgi:hypothetical protein
MKRALVVLVVATLSSLGLVSTASADPNQPSEGENSVGRNDAGVGGGPHCHLLAVESAQGTFDFIQVFPSHTGHVSSGLGEGPFVADGNCDGLP